MQIFKFLLVFAFIAFSGLLYYSRVDNTLTNEDKKYINKILEENNIKKYTGKSYKEEIIFIEQTLDAIYTVAPSGVGIAMNRTREVKDLYELKIGACFDKARVLEKVFNNNGFKTRRVALYVRKGSYIKSMLTPNILSHAQTEVLTKKGWVVLGTYEKWISLDKNNLPYSANMINYNYKKINWKYDVPFNLNGLYVYDNNILVYGLYSRHGKFYPPYNFVPDIEYNEFLDNFIN
jgi:hypothetical protein